jgi:16S rRNA C967 or C1407 C5-methylase (RsmB/RsmF family)
MGWEVVFPEDFINLLKASVGPAEKVLEALGEAPSVSIRLNPSKLRECPFPDAQPVPWSPFGYLLKERPVFTLDPLFHAGCYYVQDTSAMFVGHVFRQLLPLMEPGATVLDLCAAPGGKSTDLAASLRERWGNAFTLLANEVMRNRFGVLRSNLDTWGDPRTGCVSRDPSAFGDSPLFDAIVADVPCSGEGMFRKDAQAVAEWSLQTVEFCAARSRRILRDIWPTLKPGGFLVYSTCTFNHFENDDTVEWIASELGADILPPQDFPPAVTTRCGQVLLPGLVPGEGQYVAALRKHGEASGVRQADVFRLFQAQCPTAPESDAQKVEVDRETALRYLHGDAVVLPGNAPLGPVTLCFQGQPLGPGKNLGKRCNNLYPKAKRIKMDIR